MAERPPFPGAIGASHLRVYDGGGTPHLHTLCTEAYYVIAGTGAVETLTRGGGFESTRLEPGAMAWFTPGTIHRLVNDGDLEILVLMQNAGLPEAGDMVITFEPQVMFDAEAYAAASTLPEDERTTAGTGEAAAARRDRAVAAFVDLRDTVVGGDLVALEAFHDAAMHLVRPRFDEFGQVWKGGPVAEAMRTGTLMAKLAEGDPSHLGEASVHRIAPPDGIRRMGCCGTLGSFVA